VLVCPACDTTHGPDERFCRRCGMPLTVAGPAPPLTELQERARKVLPQYGEGELVKVAWARNQPEAEMLAGMLLEEGIPSIVRRNGGFDVPDFLAAGPRDILVAASGEQAARDLLGTARPHAGPPPRVRTAPLWVRSLAVVLVTVLIALVLAGVVAGFLR
jgi:hypothetical protein